MDDLAWRKSSFTHSDNCVEIADTVGSVLLCNSIDPDSVEVADTGRSVLVRNSNHPDRGSLALSPAAMAGFVAGCSAGELDDLA